MKLKIILTCLLFFFSQIITFANSDLIITEVHPNPIGDEKSGEFIEIYNSSTDDININDYNIEGEIINYYSNESFILHSKEFVVIHDDEVDLKNKFPGNYKRAVVQNLTARGLANTTDSIILKKGDTIIDTFEYSKSDEGISIVRPLLNCTLVINLSEESEVEATSIGMFDDIFSIPDLNLGLEFYNGTNWSEETKFSNIQLLIFRLNNQAICPLASSEFEYIIDTQEALLCGNSVQFESNKNYNFKLTLKHKISGSQRIYNIEVNNKPILPSTTPSPTTPTPTPSGTISPTPAITPTPIPTNNANINYTSLRINEVYPSPNTGENEWLEIYNFGNESIILSEWKLSDLTTTQNLEGLTISAKSYLIIESTNLKITLNNSGDEITLKNPAGSIIDVVIYPSIAKGKSYAAINGNFTIVDSPTKSSINSTSTIQPDPTPSASPSTSPIVEPDKETCECQTVSNVLGVNSDSNENNEIISSNILKQIKLPTNYIINSNIKTPDIAKEEDNAQETISNIAKDGGLALLGIFGFISTPMGKDLLELILNKFESIST